VMAKAHFAFGKVISFGEYFLFCLWHICIFIFAITALSFFQRCRVIIQSD
jgi:hypothetical protein